MEINGISVKQFDALIKVQEGLLEIRMIMVLFICWINDLKKLKFSIKFLDGRNSR